MQPLAGIRVLDFTSLLPGPLATLMLARAGAQVIKIEKPGGEDMRRYPPITGDSSANFDLLNSGKTCEELDLKNKAALARIETLLSGTDILIEQYRPGVMERLGLGYEALSKRFPALIYCSISGYGQTGSDAHRAGHDLNYIAEAGLLSLSSGPQGQPVVPPALVADIAGGSYPAIINILLALRERDRTGRGCHLDIAMSRNVMPFAFWALAEGTATGTWPGNADRLLSGGTARYRLYETADARLLAVAAIEQKFWDTFCEAIDLDPPLRQDEIDPAATIKAIAAIIRARDVRYWRNLFDKADCCVSVVATLEEAWNAAGGGQSAPALPVPICGRFERES